MKPPRPLHQRDSEFGAATLVVVMALFILIGLLAAFGNRNLLFEQRMAGGTFRGATAVQVAESGLDWAIGMLNSDKSTTTCAPSSDAAAKRFSDRYLNTDPLSRQFTPYTVAKTIIGGPADCVRTAAGDWDCKCEELADAVARDRLPIADALQPSFAVSFYKSNRAGTLIATALACTSSAVKDCDRLSDAAVNRFSAAWASSIVGFVPAVKLPPSAPVTVAGRITTTDGNLSLHNSDTYTNGILAVSGDATYPAGLLDEKLESLPGTAPRSAVVTGDSTLAKGDLSRMFLGMPLERFKLHPRLRKISCKPDCVTEISTAVSKGASMIFVDGDLDLSTNLDVGSLNEPVLIVASGSINVTGSLRMYGMLFAGSQITWNAGSGYLIGNLVSGSDLTTTGDVDIAHSSSVSFQLKNQIGGFVRTSGGWYDSKY